MTPSPSSDGFSQGLYELLVTEAIEEHIAGVGSSLVPEQSALRPAEAADRIALHLGQVIQRTIANLGEDDRVAVGVRIARDLIERIASSIPDSATWEDAPIAGGQVLRAVLGVAPDGQPVSIESPLIPLLDTTLLTNAPGEPRVGSQLVTEIGSADRIDLVMAFVRLSGVRPLLESLRRHIERGQSVRVLTTTYTGSTEAKALDALADLGVDVRVSYDVSTTRLHAKAWLFHRPSGFSTAYIGSSNLTHSAQVTGLEWNVRVSGARNPDVIDKIAAVFESYWASGDFVPYDRDEFILRTASAEYVPTFLLSPTELRAEPFQARLLEQIAVSREKGFHRNLLIAATGTGKTVMAAIDYASLKRHLRRSRLLFVAHRAEILEQSLATFRYALRDPAFGELWVGSHHPTFFEHVFASIQSLAAAGVENLAADHFDVVIVDEFHHAAAPTYEALLDYLRPIELLGLTATPERSDGLSLLGRFDNRIAAELRLWDAIDQHRLSPFTYYGISDGLDLEKVPWRRGRGYDAEGLTRLYTANDAWARQVIQALMSHVSDVNSVKALGFCVSIEHARYMARVFNEAGISSVAIWSDSPPEERRRALEDLAEGRVRVVFSVDLFNEGVDVPVVNTLLMLRPTDSSTLFLQQLGRGLRLSPEKDVCTVLDFVGHHRKEFRLDRRFRALLGGSRRELEVQIQQGFPFLPAGCHMELDPVAEVEVLANIRASIPNRWTEKVSQLSALARDGRQIRIATFLEESGLDLEEIYTGPKCWSDLCEDSGIEVLTRGPEEKSLRRAIGRLLHVDDVERLNGWKRLLSNHGAPAVAGMSERERRLARMLVSSAMESVLSKDASLDEGIDLLSKHPQVCAELLELFDVLGTPDRSHAQSARRSSRCPPPDSRPLHAGSRSWRRTGSVARLRRRCHLGKPACGGYRTLGPI